MNKKDLIDAIAKDAGITKVQAKKALESVLENIGESLQHGNKVTLIGFGSFNVSKAQVKVSDIIKSGSRFVYEPKEIISFRVSSKLIEKGTRDGGPKRK